MACHAHSIVTGLRCLGNTVRGLSQANLCTLYHTCAFPVISYASPVWFWEDKPQKGLVGSLQIAQNSALQMIYGAFHTMPIGAAHVLRHMAPIIHLLRCLSESATIQLSKLPHNHPVIKQLPDIWRDRRKPSTPASLAYTNPSRNTNIQYLSHLSSPDTEHLDPFASDNAPSHIRKSARRLQWHYIALYGMCNITISL